MIKEIPNLQTQAIHRPDPQLVEKLRRTPTGFLVDAMGGSGALDYRIHPTIAEQYAFCGVALTCHAGPADNLALVCALEHVEPGDVLVVGIWYSAWPKIQVPSALSQMDACVIWLA